MEREARRKKIASRETDRMALITGRIHNLDPNFSKASSFSVHTQDHPPAPTHARSASQPENYQPLFPGGDDEREEVNDNQKEENEKSALITTSTPPKETKYPTEKSFEYHLSSISAREIHLSIISSENTRVVCSFVIAVLVVLSHINLPHKVIKSKSLIAYRPLYAVLLTDVLIVGARLALFSQGKEEEAAMAEEKEKEVKNDDGDVQNWDGAVKLLERGLMMHQTVRALFIDCSLYLAIVICGLSVL